MKPLAAQDDQIGTAAVDLFASGMGAFILIAVIFMVLFAATPKQEDVAPVPVTEPQPVAQLSCPEPAPAAVAAVVTPAPSCPPIPEPQACPEPTVIEVPQACPAPPEPQAPACPAPVATPACPVCPICPTPQPVAAAPAPAVEVEETVRTPPEPATATTEATLLLPDYDIVFVLDSTGSMVTEIESLKRELYLVVEVLERIMPTVGIGIITFNDRLQNPSVLHYPVRRLTGDEEAMREIQRHVRNISVGDSSGPNPDIPEAILQALRTATTSTFRAEINNRLIIVITDSFAYEEEQAQSFATARAFAAVEGQRISVVHVRANPESENFLQELATSGAGEFISDRGSILANVMLSLL